ncbi:MAG: hypothetical protein R2729_20890 [Bryobacteraceae bacterium]
MELRGVPPPAVGAVVNTASFQPVISPGALVSLFGTSLGPPLLATQYDSTGRYPTEINNSKVTIGGMPAPILYMSPGQINAIAPAGIPRETAEVVVSHYGGTSAMFSVPVAETSPAIFAAARGTGQGAILNVTGAAYSFNSVDNPATPGQPIVLYATGAGRWSEPGDVAAISLIAKPFTARPLSLAIGGLSARIYYAGAAPYEPSGMIQVNAWVPETAPPGEQPVVLTVGQRSSAEQRVTIAIR